MGCDTKAYIASDVPVSVVEEIIKKHYNFETIECSKCFSGNSYRIIFKYGEDGRMLWFHPGECFPLDHDGHTILSLGLWGNSVDIMRTILNYVGGWLVENDCGDKPEYYIKAEEKISEEIYERSKYFNKVYSCLFPLFNYRTIQDILINKDKIVELLTEGDFK